MMETKLWISLCALLLINLGSAEHDNNHMATSRSPLGIVLTPEIPHTGSEHPTSLDPTSGPAPALHGSKTSTSTSSLSNSTTRDGETMSLTAEPKKDNDTNNVSPSVTVLPEINRNRTDESTLQPPIPPSASTTIISHITPAYTTTSPTHTASNTAPVDTWTIAPLSNTSHHPSPTLVPDSSSKQPTNPKTHLPTSAPAPEPPRVATTTTSTPSTLSTQSSSTFITSSSKEPPISESTTIVPPGSPSVQTKDHADNPSQLNVGGDTTMVHESPTLDPLLAGLVSAFIITAVIITLLLFLKLRRRDNRPEFRRLQDLPMDDMMEDTPLSMYSY
uniref:cell wall integrity and stress response component 4-like n=1 Tax=Monopterus albus TaxID=43700 RepID=UPI0009B4155E|nr:cell wall integrity and stress response component 4-like [Monopterus albus]